MLFTSMEFLFQFLPVVMLVHFLLPQSARNNWLLLVSLFFYAWGEPKFLFIMLFSIIFNYFLALHIEEVPHRSIHQKILLFVAVAVNLGILFVFKYLNFVTGTVHTLFPQTQQIFEQTSIVLPIGISFFTFQALSYVIDVYRGIPAQKKLGNLGLYIALFPQLIAGPIVRYTTIAEQIDQRRIYAQMFSKGVLRFVTGFNKKMLLSNLLSEVADKAFGMESLSVGMAWLGALAYTLQIFFDFSGYSDMAIGLGQMFGFQFLENFDFPYISKTVTEFWRRWHISLGSWFRDYVYFPLGGSRVDSKLRLVCNLSVVWLCTGIWHGASWNFIVWGVLYGVIIIVEKLMDLPKRLPKYPVWSVLYQIFTMLAVVCGWVLFRSADLSSALIYLKAMFGLTGNTWTDPTFAFYVREYLVIFGVGILCATPVFRCLEQIMEQKGTVSQLIWVNGSRILQIVFFVVCISFLVINAHNPFIYFHF